MTNQIQQARDILAKWREAGTPGAWRVEQHRPDIELVPVVFADPEALVIEADAVGHDDARLIVGTAGNPDLLAAIDAMFATYLAAHSIGPTYRRDTERIAAAIIAADERMAQ